eukprot:TRINITY_DN8396_c0_g1_i1.p1 TRINITY_DN8396_c0_g1~~TRINITY_DN8396_c0_g1_i1.p1  ORF type:complete len:228 (+),score=21.18 TRINITY_DN8396_c0_g1_i1:31-684(+)
MGSCMAAESQELTFDEISRGESEWNSVAKHLQGHGGEKLRVRKLWRIKRSELFASYEAKNSKLGAPTLLFHGTSQRSAQSISASGFKLPHRSGLYGPGIYFADDARKSVSYVREDSCSPFLRRWLKEGKGFLSSMLTTDGGHLLLCDVYLGAYKRIRSSRVSGKPAEDLKGDWMRKMMGFGDYHSLYVHSLLGLFYSEYVIFQEHQAIPRYVIEFEH